MAAIDIGLGAVDLTYYYHAGYTGIDKGNPANLAGTFTSFEIWMYSACTDSKVGTFFASQNYTLRDFENIGAISAGSKQTFTGKSCVSAAGDFIGFYSATGMLEKDNNSGLEMREMAQDNFGDYLPHSSYDGYAGDRLSLYATGTSADAPTVTTQAGSSITTSGFTGNGNITATGGISPTRKGFCYKVGTSGDPVITDSIAYDDGSYATGAYTKAIAGLSPGVGYRVRAYATNLAGTSYGATVQVTTTVAVPTVTTQAGSSITSSSCTGNGNITAMGGSNATRRGFCYKEGTSGDPVITDSIAYDDGSYSTGAFTKAVTGLKLGTSYLIRAYATNSAGTAYGTTVVIVTTATDIFGWIC